MNKRNYCEDYQEINATFVFHVEGYQPLYKILNLEVVDEKKYDRLFYLYYTKFTSDVKARDLTRHLGILK